MALRLENLSIRARIGLLTSAILVLAGSTVAWLLDADLQRRREAAADEVRILASDHAADLQRLLDQTEGFLSHLAARPLVRALDPRNCDPLVEEFAQLDPQYVGIAIRDAAGRNICSFVQNPLIRMTEAEFPWFGGALRQNRFSASPGFVGPATGRYVSALTYPIRNDAGEPTGLLILPVDLSMLNARMLGSVPANALVSVLDQEQGLLLRSQQPELYVGQRQGAAGSDPPGLPRKGIVEANGRDGVQRLFAIQTLPHVGWSVAAGLRREDVYAGYDTDVHRTIGAGLGLMLVAFALVRSLGGAIVKPIVELQDAARRVAAGHREVRVFTRGPPEVQLVSGEFNRMLDALALAEGRQQAVFDSVSEVILTTDADQRIVMANQAAGSVFRRDAAQLVGTPLGDLMPERFRANHRLEVERFGARSPLSRHMSRRSDLTGLRADGEEFPIDASISHLHVGGQLLYTVVLRDITERRRAEAALQESREKLDIALASMSDAVFISDAQGRLVEFNDAFATFHRFRNKAECFGNLDEYARILDLFLPDGRPAERDRWPSRRALDGETGTSVEYHLQRRDTGERWIGSYSFAPLRDDRGKITGAVVTARDVTELRSAQFELEASHANLQRLVGALDKTQEEERRRIARELHDDLQQTLAAIRMEAEAFDGTRRDGDELGPVLARIDDLAKTAVTSTRRIVNDLRPQAMEEMGLVGALDALASRFAQRTGTTCEVETGARPEDGTGEPSPEIALCLYRVAQESLNNVAKHARAHHVNIRLDRFAGAGWRLRVADDGCGMAADDHRKPQSFGLLGMNERVQALGGSLRITGRPGGGTIIEIEIPPSRSDDQRRPGGPRVSP